MPVQIEYRDSFSVIGKLGEGLAAEGGKWIPVLWEKANHSFDEIRDLAKKDNEGNLVGLWGAMSDISESFERWTDQGKYLAGCEVVHNCNAPAGWVRWVIPAYKYAIIQCNLDTYDEKFRFMITEYLPSNNYSIVGAVHEFYKPGETDEGLWLYFPIERA